ncbi:Urea amidolyase [Alloalcanivorax dieselolei B5]|uniref:Biotin carboxylase n=1 Tax=Alcanivorax dieselolei (strain DSM 16502 / CGMCC 1.3690 / MCCC 1A00001 / B-5) TaxID=930169 RepID=K0C6C0_ALCDB|nr:urea carboxylase [Alloalcanivorax dieselolei]AFT69024.1 Urea amidolyase [Alloalcanivorax dieselolei B5]GGJ81921.1 urea carboxylase [Alloalcanivorax dieselolei]
MMLKENGLKGTGLKKVLIANRGEIAVRICRTLKQMGIASVAVYSDADRNSQHVSAADEAVALGGQTAAESYLRTDAILKAARETGADGIIPGYGFLSENADFAEACDAEGIAFIGPTPTQLRQFGLKHEARALAEAAGVPLAPGTGLLKDLDEARQAALEIGYPVMLKSTAGGGGIGLTRCNSEEELVAAFESVRRLGESFFSDSGVFLERFVARARHIEVQIFGDGDGTVLALGERECSLQRRNQKVVEETPAPNLPEATREQLRESARRLGESVNYRSAGTVEYVYDDERDEFYFLEVNTRLQVEHGVTEEIFGVDLVAWMVMLAGGERPPLDQTYQVNGHAMEVRIYAEDPLKAFQPSPGELTEVVFPAAARLDGWVDTGTVVSPHYDPLLAKLIVHADDREAALRKMQTALAETRLSGIATNLDYLRQILIDPNVAAGRVSTRYLETFEYRPRVFEVQEPGTYTTVQDYPGRAGYWDVGVPPSGPMDDYAFRLANRIVGNHDSAAGLEATLIGPTLYFHSETIVALTGATCDATLDGEAVALWQPIRVRAGQTLVTGKVTSGCRTYIAIRNGIDVPDYLGSKSTFVLGQFGGHGGRTLRKGDVLSLCQPQLPGCPTPAPVHEPSPADGTLIPDYPQHWQIKVLYGPHGAPDYFTQDAIDTFFGADYQVHYNSNRLGIRLTGPKPTWARTDGGEAGLHPSNLHDNEYAIGSINFTGDFPVILTKDGPSLGGFVCPVTIAKAELWKVGQLKPGDSIRFVAIDFDQALALEQAQDRSIESLTPVTPAPTAATVMPEGAASPTMLVERDADGDVPRITYRQAGDKYILIEYGENVLDLALRFRVHALMESLKSTPVDGILELSPGVRSLQVHYDSRRLHQKDLVAALLEREAAIGSVDDLVVPTRVVHLPLAFEDSATLDAVQRYQETIRPDAPWLPNNAEFIRRINGLDSIEAVKRIVYDASYMVLGLGDVYLGAPCAVPVDPRHRLMTSKYNPARTYTAEGTVGIGGVYMCIYGMDSPGGYQLVGRTLPIWNKHLKNPQFKPGEPWLLKFFDQVRYYPVSEAELGEMRDAFREGRLQVEITEEPFSLAEYRAFLESIEPEMEAFRERQQSAYQAEVQRWQDEDAAVESALLGNKVEIGDLDGHVVSAEISGNVWKLLVEEGARVEAGQTLVVVEAMKMEFAITASAAGTVTGLHCKPGTLINAGDPVAVIDTESAA